MLSEQVKRICNDFLFEAKHSPRMLSDIAAMENYLAESYGERILIELLQNADDANSSKALLRIIGDTVIFANTGRAFTETDLLAICRSGSSYKKRGMEIGYRGVGFKSTTSLTKEIIISSNDTLFTFSKSRCASMLNMKESEVPTVRIPFLVELNEFELDIQHNIHQIHNKGYNSIFIFRHSNISIIKEEIRLFEKSNLLFLKNINELIIESANTDSYFVNRVRENGGVKIDLTSENKTDFWWLPIINEESNFAFKMDASGNIIECESNEAVFHCYLPTLESCPFKFKINADFSTDPSRKHLTLDNNTKVKLINLSETLQTIIQKCINSEIPHASILTLISSRISYTSAATTFYNDFIDVLFKKTKVTLNSGSKVTLENYLRHEDFLSIEEKQFISMYSDYFVSKAAKKNNIYLEEFIQHFSKAKYTAQDYSLLLSDKVFARRCDCCTYAKVFAYVLRGLKINSILSGKKLDLSNFFLKLDKTNLILADNLTELTSLNNELIENLIKYVDKSDWEWFSSEIGLNYDLFGSEKKIKSEINIQKGVIPITKWRSAEQQCVDIEKSFGYNASYVGSKNLGYDVESKMTDGRVRYIEVKLLSSDTGTFTITNNEYSAAHQYGDSYYICIIIQKDNSLKAVYIRNPLENIRLEKRVRQWEWYCESFSGEEYSFSY